MKIDRCVSFHALSLNSDQDLICPYNFIPESLFKVARMKDMITNLRSF